MEDRDIEQIYELSPMQQAMLFHSLYAPGSGVYVIQQSLRLTGPLDAAAFQRSWQHLVDRHAILRTGFFWEDLEKPVQVVHRKVELRVRRASWRGLPPEEQRERLRQELADDATRDFDLAEPPLLRLTLIELGEDVHQLLWSYHHLLSDGWSQGLLLQELFASYAAFAAGRTPELGRERPFREYIAWLQRQDLGQAESFWRRTLAGFTSPTYVAEGADRATEHASQEARRAILPLSATTSAALRYVARRQRLTLNTLVQGAWALLLTRLTGRDDVVFGTTVSGRPADLPGVESIIGLFINTLPVRLEVAPERPLSEWLAGLQKSQVEMRRFEHSPLVEVQRWSDLPPGVALFDHILVFENLALPQEGASPIPGLHIQEESASTSTNYPLNVVVIPGAAELTLTLLYDAARFHAVDVTRLLDRLAGVLAAFAEEGEHRLGEIPVLLPAERHQVLAEWNDTGTAFPREASLPALFAEVAAAWPDAPALVAPRTEETWSYRRLDEESNRLARRLRALGVGRESRVGISMDRSPELILGTLAILKAGGAYVPLDAAYPDERLAFMLADTGVRLVLVHAATRERLAALAPVLAIEEDSWRREAATPLAIRVPAESLAYVIYTSGSTGRPKGVAVPHRAIARLVRDTNYVRLGPGERTGQVANISFDAATYEIWGALLTGAATVVTPREVVLSPADFAGWIREHGITTMFLTSALFTKMSREVPDAFATMSELLVGGEAVDPVAARTVLAGRPPRRLLNGYGPTESTTFATWHHIREVPDGATSIPIGGPLANTTLYVLDRSSAALPAGSIGELCIGGDGLAWGYLNRPELTAERFVPHPWGKGERLYRTGDLVRQRPDGAIDYLGRLDQQVKIRGFRIEPGEIEAVLANHPEIRECAVLARQDVGANPGDTRLVAYAVLRPESGLREPGSDLRSWLAERLPDYMVPSAFLMLDALPLTANGKLDRRALPAPERTGSAGADSPTAPSDPIEAEIAGIWSEVLGVERVGVNDDFFALGGHSLLATQVISRIRGAFEVDLPLRELFDSPTVAGIARAVRAARGPEEVAPAAPPPPVIPVAREAIVDGQPLSVAQQRLWLLDQLEPGNPAYNVPLAVRLTGEISTDLLTRIFSEIVARHETLRTTFASSQGEPVQVIAETAAPPELPVFDLAPLEELEREARAREILREEAGRPFDLRRGPLLRPALVRLAEGEHHLLVVLHHIVADGGSARLLLREVAALYAAFSQGNPSPLPPLPLQYAAFAAEQREWLRSAEFQEQLAWWKQRLAGAPPALELPTDRPRPALQTFRGAAIPVSFPGSLEDAVREVSRRAEAAPFVVLLTAWAALLGRHANQEDVLIGTPVAGRDRPEAAGLIGFLVNDLVLRVDLTGAPGFGEALRRTGREVPAAFAHRDLPFERLADELLPERDLAHAPLFQVLFALREPAESLSVPGLTLAPYPVDSGTAKLDLSLLLSEGESGFSGRLEFNTDLFDRTTARRLLERFGVLLEAALDDMDAPVADLPLLPAAERHQALLEWNDAWSAYPRDASIPELFRHVARERPDAPAVVTEGEVWSYRRLDEASDRLARRLRAHGVGPETPVAVSLERSPELIVAILAILKAGGAYVPIDAGYPEERLAYLLSDSGARTVLVHERTRERLAGKAALLAVDGEDWETEEAGPLPVTLTRESLALVIYTSGSTGRPKGVALPHRGVVRLVRESNYLRLGREDRMAHAANIGFDAATLEIWGALLNGAALVVIPRETALSPADLAARLDEERVTALFLTTALFNQVAWEAPAAFAGRTVMFGGEAADPAAVAKALEAGAPERLLHLYGPAESTTLATWYAVGDVPAGAWAVPIGLPVGNSSVYVLDRRRNPVPPGAVGELCVGGDGLARGYLHKPELTAERFIPHRWGRGERLYRTGDLVRQRADGSIEFVGRRDDQVKIRGFRIELGEIEAVLGSHPGVRECVVMAREDSPGIRLLAAYFTSEITSEETRPAEGDLRAFLTERLPDYMVPSVFIPLDALPLSPNGKVDRRRLPAPDRTRRRGTAPFVAPRNPAEQAVAAIWRELLGLDEVSVEDGFFTLGGHSLLATRVLSRVRQSFGVEIALRELFTHPTVAGLAVLIDARGGVLSEEGIADGLAARPKALPETLAGGATFPLSFAQQRLWIIDQLDPGSPAYNVPAVVRLTGDVSVELLSRIFAEVVARHEALRTTFGVRDEQPVQVIAPVSEATRPALPLLDLSGLPEAEREAPARAAAREEALRSFDLRRGPLLRLALVRLGEREHLLLVTMHHIVSDGWSMGVLLREVAALYEAFAQGRPSPLPDLPVQYADFSVWQRQWLRGDVLDRQLSYWKRQLADAPVVLELPTDRPRPAVQTFDGASLTLALPPRLSEAVHALCQREGATPFMVLLAAWGALLGRLSNQDDVLLGTPIAGRNRREIEDLIGFFVNTLVLRVDLSGALPFRELVGRVRQAALDAFTYQDLPFERLVEELALDRALSHSPLFQVLFALQNAPVGNLAIPGLSLEPVPLEGGTAKFDLTLTLGEGASGFAGGLEYNTDLFDRGTVERLAARFLTFLEGAAGAPDLPVPDLPLLLLAEREQLVQWNETGAAEAETAGLCLHDLFAAQAARTPDGVALVHGNRHLTYAELAARAGGLGRRLRDLGVGREKRVAVCLERSPDLIATLLGVLAAGGAYVPIDPAYPVERRMLMMEDSGAAVLVTRGSLALDLPVSNARVLDLDVEAIPAVDGLPGESGVGPDNLAYLIYTSGSTGRPKGVAIEHRSAVALASWARGALSADELSGVLASTSVCFDLSVFEIFVPLAWGGRVILADNALALPALPAAGEVRLLNTVPSAATELVRLGGLPASVRTVCLAGEPLPAALAARLYATGTVQRVLNLYGPSEDTTYSTGSLVPHDGERLPAIGRPIHGTRAHVVDRHGTPVPPGVAGELWLAGAGLARGYLGRPELTAERFTPDPFTATDPFGGPGERVYRTGDLVRFRLDGELEFLGRIDHQVKVRGFRVELGEVESVLWSHPAVRECVVLVREDIPGVRLLVAYVTGQPLPVPAELQAFLAGRLPDYMVPSVFVPLEALPLSPNGKVDRKRLPAPDRARRATQAEMVPPRTATEHLLVEMWKELLNLEAIGVHDGFFELGGHSLLATQVLARVRQSFGVDIPLREVFRTPTVAGLAELIDTQTAELPVDDPEIAALLAEIEDLSDDEARARLVEVIEEIGPAPETGPAVPGTPPQDAPAGFPLSFSQQRLWIIDQIDPGLSAYNVPATVRLTGEISVDLLTRIFAEVVARHDALRTTFTAHEGRPVQVVAPVSEASRPRIPVVDLSALPDGAREETALTLARQEALLPFDLQRGPLLRLALVRLGGREHLLLVTMHHIVSDGWSMGVLLREIGVLHQAFSQGLTSPLPPLTTQYADFAAWQRSWLQGEVLEEQLQWWRQELEGAPVALELPMDRPRPPLPRNQGEARTVDLPAELTARIKEISWRERATPFMVLLATWQALLHRHGGQQDVLVGTPVANRNRFEIEGLIGFFVNTLVLRGRFGEEGLTFRRLLGQTRDTSLGAFGHQDMPFEKLVEELVPERNQAIAPLFQVFFGLQNSPRRRLSLPGLSLEPVALQSGVALFELSLELVEVDGRLTGQLELRRDLFDPPTATRLLESFGHLLRGMLDDPERRIAEVPLLGEAERHQLIREWNDGGAPAAWRPSIVAMFERQADLAPDAPALSQVGRADRLSYRDLDRRANRLAHRLRRSGVGPEVRVAVLLERSPELIVALLGILKAGGVYVPLDPAYPADRLTFMLEDSEASLLITQESLVHALPARAPAVLVVESAALEDESDGRLSLDVAPEQLAYVIYTSGSTGRPKGTMVSHGAIASYAETVVATYGIHAGERVLQFCSISFDTSVEEIVASLTRGAELVLRNDAMLESAARFLATCGERELNVLSLPTGYWNELTAKLDAEGLALPSPLRLVIIGGERALPERVAAWRRRAPEHLRLVNSYGVTEATIASMVADVTHPSRAEARGEVSIGRPAPESEVHLLDREGEPVPIGVPGELCLGGSLLARGYLKRPGVTAERFVPHPFSPLPGARLYRTGDLARTFPDGEMEFLGRKDQQVKVRGYRIELSEIESRLLQHPEVESAVVAVQDDARGEKLIVGYVVPRRAPGPELWALLRAFLRETLPDYMVPGALVALEALPLNPNGKVDRAALPPAPPPEAGTETAAVAPRDPMEILLADIWSEVLGVGRVGLYDDFFALGGHSLLATQVVSRIRKTTGVDLPLRKLFETPTIAELARAVWAAREAGTTPAPPLVPVPREGADLPLSFAQQRLWLIDQLEPGSPAYNIPSAVRLTGELSVDLLERIFAEIVDRHEALRTTFGSHEGRPVQLIAPQGSPPEISFADLSDLPEAERDERARALVLEESRRPFDLQRGPLLRLGLVRLGEWEHLLLITMHHIVSDGWSMGVLVREIGALYEALSQGRPSPLPALPVQYADFAVWQRDWLRGEVLDEQIARWKRRLDGAPRVLELPTDRPRPALPARRGASHPVALSPALSEAVRLLCRREGVTPFMALLSAWAVLLGRHANQDDVLVGTPVAGRNRRELEDLIGFFVNTLVLRNDMTGAPTFGDLLGRVRETALDAFTDQDVPFERLVEELVTERDLAVSPLFQVLFTLQNAPAGDLEIPGLVLSPVAADGGQAKFDLTLGFQEGPDGFQGALEYDTDLFDAGTAERLLARFQVLLEAAASAAATPIAELPLLEPAERRQILEWGGTAGEPSAETLHGRFEAQARQAPDAVAVVFEEASLTYGELNRRANQLAWRLRALGVGPEHRVGLCAERSLDLLVGLLGILKSGGAYVPLDPRYPQERLVSTLEDAGVRVLVGTREAVAGLPEGAERVLLDGHAEALGALPAGNPEPWGDGSSLAYVIYTSGSTGRPKGSLVTHGNVVRLFDATDPWFGFGRADVWSLFHSYAFDFSVWEIWGALLYGGRLVVVPYLVSRSPEDFHGLLAREGVTVLNQTPSAFAQLQRVDEQQEDSGALRDLRLVIFGGEALDLGGLAPWFARHGDAKPLLVNMYGITETTVHVTWRPVREPDVAGRRSVIGVPIPDLAVHVLDRSLQVAPVGVPGELVVAGAGLARGYLGRPDLTAERFIPDPVSGRSGARVYRSGDLARYLPDGDLEYLGRIDHQVKIRGFRIEPGEIEAVLGSHPAVRECVVVVREDTPGLRLLAAYVVGAESPPDSGDLRLFLGERLPDYMLPAAFVVLDRMPLSQNGKVDRRALPAPDRERRDRQDFVAPRTRTEEVLAGIWQELLGMERVSVEDGFFELGGHSLLATQVLARIRQIFAVDLPLRDVFLRPTVAGLAELIDAQLATPPVDEDEMAALLAELDELSDEEARVRLEDLKS